MPIGKGENKMADLATIKAELDAKFETQLCKWDYVYFGSAIVPNGVSTPLQIQIEEDAHFEMTAITGVAFGPVDLNTGALVTTESTDFPNPVNTSIAQSGMSAQFRDKGSSKDLFSDKIPVECFLTPGYGQENYPAYPFHHVFKKTATLLIELQNRDSAADPNSYGHYVGFALKGQKYLKSNKFEN